jgi:ATP-binding protein involved in chromosome partitioning
MLRTRGAEGTDVQWKTGVETAPGSIAPSMEGPAEHLMSTTGSTATTPGSAVEQAVRAALATVDDPEIHKPITDLGMVKGVAVSPDGLAHVGVYLTVAGCPMRETITSRVTEAVSKVSGVTAVEVELDVMSDEQRTELRRSLRGDAAEPVIPFAQPGSLTRVYCVASGKGGVGKSSVTVNLAAAMAAKGLSVGVVDADIYGHSVPRMLGTTDRPTKVDDMIMPPQAHGVKVISIGMFTPGNDAVVWRGPMLHRALQQFLADVFWGDLDVLLLDLPPGTGDIAISTAQLVPNAELLVVTTPQTAAAEVAERAGSIALQTRQRLAGVVENMSWMEMPDGTRMEVFGTGGGQTVADSLTRSIGAPVPLLGQVPLEPRLRECGDSGNPIVLAEPESASAQALRAVAEKLTVRSRGLAGMSLNISPVRK